MVFGNYSKVPHRYLHRPRSCGRKVYYALARACGRGALCGFFESGGHLRRSISPTPQQKTILEENQSHTR